MRIATHLAQVLSEKGYEVTVFARRRPAFPLPAAVDLRTIRDTPPDSNDQLSITSDPAEFEALTSLVMDAMVTSKLDVLHFHYALPFAAVAREVRRRLPTGLPRIIGTLHGTDVSLQGARAATQRHLSRALASADALTTVSRSHALLIRNRFGRDPLVIPNFVDLRVFHPRAEARGGRPRVLHMSNFRPVKNTLSVARAFALLHARMDAVLWLVGEGETLPDTLNELRRLGVPNSSVRTFGMVESPSSIVARTDVMLVPSYLESFSMAALEAMACGVPVVGTRVGGLKELIEDRDCGVLVSPGDDGALASALEIALHRKSALRRGALGRAAEFSVDTIVPWYEELYRDVLEGGGSQVVSTGHRSGL